MLQKSAAIPIPGRHQPDGSDDLDNGLLDPIFRLAGEVRDVHVLIIAEHGAEHGLDLMCGLIRNGCLAATILRAGSKPDSDEYDLVIALPPATAPLDAMIRQVRDVLAPNGRLIACVPNGRSAAALSRRLRLNGFSAPRSVHLTGSVLVRADLRSVS